MEKVSSENVTMTARVPLSVVNELKGLAGLQGRSLNNYLNKVLPELIRNEKEKIKEGRQIA